MKKILIFWKGLPACSALTNSLAKSPEYHVDLFYTQPSVPFENLHTYLDGIKSLRRISSIKDIPEPYELSKYNLIIVTGWYSHQWNRNLQIAKKINRSLIVASAIDNIKAIKTTHKLRQLFGMLAYRVYLSRIFDYCLVPGTDSSELMKFLGHPSSKIYQGYYGASSQIYSTCVKIRNRPKNFLFVGQIIPRKGIDILINAFKLYQKAGGTYGLTIVGSTDEKEDKAILSIEEFQSIQLLSFAQPDKIADLMNWHRVLITPSRFDHWATVVCEAAACGCLLVASKQVGASNDIIKNGINGFVFDALKKSPEKDLAAIMHKLELLLDSESAEQRSMISQKISSLWSEHQYKLSVEAMLK